MENARDKAEDLNRVFPSNDPDYKACELGSTDQKTLSPELGKLIKYVFRNNRLLDEIYVDPSERTKLRFWYRVLTFFGKRDLKVKVRLPKKPNIYYVDNNWQSTGDYYIDPVEIWWSDHGQNVLTKWKDSCNITKPVFDRDQFMEDHKFEEEIEEAEEKEINN